MIEVCSQSAGARWIKTTGIFGAMASASSLYSLESERMMMPSDAISGFLLNLRFMHGELTASTGVSYRTFSTDKSLEFEWDSYIRQFFKEHSLYFSEDL